MIFGQTVVRVRPGQRPKRTGGTEADWANVTRETITGVSVQPLAGAEDAALNRDVTTIGYRLLSDPDRPVPDITSTDRLEYRGETFTVDGPIGYWPDPVDTGDHLELVLTGYRGA